MKRKATIRDVLAGLYLIFVCYLVFFGSFREGTNTEVHYIPLETTIELVTAHWNQTVWWMYFTILGNLLLLFPIPFLFRMQWRGWRSVLLIILIPFGIESLQFLFQLGSADIDDVMFNAIGFATGFWVNRLIKNK